MRYIDKLYPFCVPLLLLFAYYIYSPGFSAGFMLDDEGNIGQFVNVRAGFEGLWNFFRHTERPLAFLSFMLNDNVWPSTPDIFVQTNMLLHLFCACLLMICFILIGKNLGWHQKKNERIALISSFLWLIHPLFVSTVLYIVQRMTILSAMFVLLSLISYLYGRLELTNGDKKAWFWLLIATPVFGVFGILCKENAALIPLYLLVFEITVFSRNQINNKYYLLWKRFYIYLPVIFMVFSIFYFKDAWLKDYFIRDYDLLERLLTEANILIYYLYLIIIPKSSTNGLHYENYPISTSLIEPWTTIPAIAIIFLLVLIFFIKRKKVPVYSLAVFFFFAGHLMESTFLGLELYFEHRNYLPSMMLFFAFTFGLFQLYEKHKKVITISFIIIMCMYSGLTYARAKLWGDQLMLLSVWAENNPGSPRNYIEGHIKAHKLHHYELAVDFIDRGIKALPDNVFLWIGHIAYGCKYGTLNKSDIDRLKVLLEETKESKSTFLYKNLNQLMKITFSPNCSFITITDMRDILLAALKNPHVLKENLRMQEIIHLIGHLELEAKNYIAAKENFLKSLKLFASPSTALQQVALLGTYNQYDLAYDYLLEARALIYDKYDEENRKNTAGWKDFSDMESILLTELKKQSKDNYDIRD